MTPFAHTTPSARHLYALLLLAFLHQASLHATRPLVGLYAQAQGSSPQLIGAMVAIYSISAVLLAMPIGQLVDRTGSRFPALLGSLLQTVGLGLVVYPGGLLWLGVSQLMLGVGHLLFQVAIQSSVAAAGRPGEHERNFGHYTFFTAAGQFVGPGAAGWITDQWGLGSAFGWAGVVAAISVVTVFATAISPVGHRRVPGESFTGNTVSLLRNNTMLRVLTLSVVALFGYEALASFFPLYAQERGIPVTITGLVLSVRAMFSMAVRPALGWLAMRFGRQRVLTHTLFWGGLSLSLLGVFGKVMPLLLVAAASGATFGLAFPITMAMVVGMADQSQRGLALSLRLVGNRLGSVLSPLVFGFVAAGFGYAPVLWFAGAAVVVGARWALGLPKPAAPASSG